MRKLLVLLTVAAGFFVFGTSAFAQFIDTCDDTPTGTIERNCAAVQGSACSYFDYETGAGYGPGSRGTGNYHAVFSICLCDNAGTNFVAGRRIGVRLTILVNGAAGQQGAYWSAPASADVRFGKFSTLTGGLSGIGLWGSVRVGEVL